VVNDTYEHLASALQEAGEAREALNDALQAARQHMMLHFAHIFKSTLLRTLRVNIVGF
jgi:hypothetical protein